MGRRNGLFRNVQFEYSQTAGGGDTPFQCEGGLLINTPSVMPLRLNGGGDTSFDSQDNMDDIDYQSNSILENDSSISNLSERDSQHINESDLSFVRT